MLQKYYIMPHAIILCLFGLTLMTVSPVFAQQNTPPPCSTLEQCGVEITQLGERTAEVLAQVGAILTELQSRADMAFEKAAEIIKNAPTEPSGFDGSTQQVEPVERHQEPNL